MANDKLSKLKLLRLKEIALIEAGLTSNEEFDQYVSENFHEIVKLIGQGESVERKKRGML